MGLTVAERKSRLSRADNSASMANLQQVPPAEVGNTRAATHFGTANALSIPDREACFAQIAAAVLIREPDGSLPAAYEPLVWVTAGELARYKSCERWVEERGMFSRTGKLNPAAEHMRKTAKGLAELLDRLALSPRSAGALGLDLQRAQNFDLARHWAEQDANRG